MNINYYEKIKKFLFYLTKKNISLITNASQPAGRAKKVNPILNCGVGQSSPHFAGQNAGRAKTGRTGPLCHP